MGKVKKELRFLIVDDSLSARAHYRHILTASCEVPFRITEATNAVEAISVLDNERIDCILLDENVSGMIFDDLIKSIKKSINQNTPIILLTNKPAKISASMQDSGVVASIVKKDVETNLFIDTIKRATLHVKEKQNLISRMGLWLFYGIGLVTLSIALLVLTGLCLHISILVQGLPDAPPMQYNTALLLVLMAVGFLSINIYPRATLFMSVLIFIAATLTGLQYLFDIDFGLDTFLIKPFLVTNTPSPGRMAPNTALSLIAASAALFLNAKNNLFRYQQALAIYLSALVFIMSLVALAGYLLHMPTAYIWGRLTGMNILAAFCMTAVGMALLLFSLGQLPEERRHIKQFPLATAVFGSVFFLLLWQALITEDQLALHGKSHVNEKATLLRYIFPGLSIITSLLLTWLLATVQYFWIKSNRQKNNLVAAIKKQQITEKRFQAVTVSANDAIIMLDNEARVVFWNRAATEIFGYDSRQATGRYIHGLVIPDRYLEALEAGFRIFQTTGKGTIIGKNIEATAKRKNGVEFPVEISISSVLINDKWEAVAIVRDITERKKAEEIIRHNANHDALTDLPNRALFSELLKTELIKADRTGGTVSLLAIDLDDFKPVNDTYGHEMGDDVLRLVSQRLQQCIRKSDTVARVGGDEFSIILADIHNEQEILLIVQKILVQLANNFGINGTVVSISASIGIANYPQDSKQQDLLIINADYAMYAAKKTGKNQYHFYSKPV